MLGQKARNKGLMFGTKTKIGEMLLSKIFSVEGNLIRFAVTKKGCFMITLNDKPLKKTDSGYEIKECFLNKVAEIIEETKYEPKEKLDKVISKGKNVGKRIKAKSWTEPVMVEGKPKLLVIQRVKIEGNTPFVVANTYDPEQDNETESKVKKSPKRKVTLKGDVE